MLPTLKKDKNIMKIKIKIVFAAHGVSHEFAFFCNYYNFLKLSFDDFFVIFVHNYIGFII